MESNPKNESFWGQFRNYFHKKETVRETIEDLLEEAGHDDNQLSKQEQLLLNNILYLKDKKCCHVMVPRAEIEAFQKDGTVEEIGKLMIEKGHSRIPVYGDSLDDILGVAHIIDVTKSLMKGKGKAKAETIVANRTQFVSPSMRVLDLLSDMQKNKIHIAMVVDEYGGIDGLVTIEDLLEEIVGDIEDEYDFDHEPEITQQSDDVIVAEAKAQLDEIKEKTSINLRELIKNEEDEEVDTLGGLIFVLTQRIPQRGEVIETKSNVQFRILDVDSRRIKKVMIVVKNSADNSEASAKNS